jgi:thioredoxin-related protein
MFCVLYFRRQAMFLKVLLFIAVCMCSCAAHAQNVPPPSAQEVDSAEVYRRGDTAVIVGEGPRSAESEAFSAAMAPPEDDSHKWFVTVWSTDNCSYCERLKTDFQQAPALLAFVSAPEQSKAWAHYNVYHGKDQTQEWRRKAYKITNYPTIVIQPPRDWSWGSPRTVVFYQVGYDGNPARLANAITATVRKYAEVKAREGYPKPPRSIESMEQEWLEELKDMPGDGDGKEEEASTIKKDKQASQAIHVNQAQLVTPLLGQVAPFQTPPPVDPFNPNPSLTPNPNNVPYQWPLGPNQQNPYQPGPSPFNLNFGLTDLTGSQTLTNLILAFILGSGLFSASRLLNTTHLSPTQTLAVKEATRETIARYRPAQARTTDPGVVS